MKPGVPKLSLEDYSVLEDVALTWLAHIDSGESLPDVCPYGVLYCHSICGHIIQGCKNPSCKSSASKVNRISNVSPESFCCGCIDDTTSLDLTFRASDT